jgi:hypothetical protein
VIYDRPEVLGELPDSQRYRFVKYDPANGVDYTWEREWRIKTNSLQLDPTQTLVMVPTSADAFEVVYELANEEPDWDVEGSTGKGFVVGSFDVPK